MPHTTIPTNQRIVDRHIQGALFRKLKNTPVIMSDGGTVTGIDIQRLLLANEVYVLDVELHRSDSLPLNIFVWSAKDPDGKPVYGQLKLHLEFNSHQIMVSAEITVLNIDPVTFKAAVEAQGDDVLSTKDRLLLIESISRRAIQDLRERPGEVTPVVGHLVDIVDLIETLTWID
jgi:hypothetical protein